MTSNHVLHMEPGPHLSASISQTPWGYKFRGTTWTTMGRSAGFCSMKTLIEEFPTWVRGNLTGLSKVKVGHESLASAGILKPLTTSVSIVNETLYLQRKQNKKITKGINRNYGWCPAKPCVKTFSLWINQELGDFSCLKQYRMGTSWEEKHCIATLGLFNTTTLNPKL